MAGFASGMSDFWDKLISIFSTYNILSDTLDIIFIAFIIYEAIKLLRNTRAILLAKGLVLLVVIFIVVSVLKMQASTYLFKKIFDNIIIILIIIFSPEIRNALESVGRSRITNLNIFTGKITDRVLLQNEQNESAIRGVCKACADMSNQNIGALIVFEKGTPLGEIIATGTIVDAKITSELVSNIFYPKAPLHDGAAIIRDGKLLAAGCILPLTQNNELSSELGTRHRAAIGISEQSDAMVVIISEETGYISVAHKGTLERNISDGSLREKLTKFLIITEETHEKKSIKKFFGGLHNGK